MATFKIRKGGKEISVVEALEIAEKEIIPPYDPLGFHSEESDVYVFQVLNKLFDLKLIDSFDVIGKLTEFESKEGVVY